MLTIDPVGAIIGLSILTLIAIIGGYIIVFGESEKPHHHHRRRHHKKHRKAN